MRNKYMRRGVLMLLGGIALNLVGYNAEKQDLDIYKWEMAIGTVLFGLGFLTILYSLIRKVERAAILEERAGEHENHEQVAQTPEISEKTTS